MGHQTLIDLRCPQCVALGRGGLLGRILRQQWDSSGIAAHQDGAVKTVLDAVLWCSSCKLQVVFALVAVNPVDKNTACAPDEG